MNAREKNEFLVSVLQHTYQEQNNRDFLMAHIKIETYLSHKNRDVLVHIKIETYLSLSFLLGSILIALQLCRGLRHSMHSAVTKSPLRGQYPGTQTASVNMASPPTTP